VQFPTPENPEYIPGFLYCIDGIEEKYTMQAFLIWENSEIKILLKYVVASYAKRDTESQGTANGQAFHDWACGCAVVYSANPTYHYLLTYLLTYGAEPFLRSHKLCSQSRTS
jgi:hypothetical protein